MGNLGLKIRINMKTKISLVIMLALALTLPVALMMACRHTSRLPRRERDQCSSAQAGRPM